MFGKQGGAITRILAGAGMPTAQARAITNIFAQCRAPLEHRGSADFSGPVAISGPMNIESPDPESSVLSIAGILLDDLIEDGTARLELVNGPTVVIGGYFVPTDKKIASGTRVGAARYWKIGWHATVSQDCLVPV